MQCTLISRAHQSKPHNCTDLEDVSRLEARGDGVKVSVQRDEQAERAARRLQRSGRGGPAPAAQRHAAALAPRPPRLHPVLAARRAAAHDTGLISATFFIIRLTYHQFY